ncbi:MAG TPA: copper-binding protein [Ramlibacter sp.]|nr:copper-binding protein [Ramlibacter sp.]
MIARIAATLLTAAFAAGAFADTALTEGEVRKVDRASGKITLRHGEIKNLDMPPMTMVFGVRDKALLANVAAGDKVKFAADKDGSQYIVTAIEK